MGGTQSGCPKEFCDKVPFDVYGRLRSWDGGEVAGSVGVEADGVVHNSLDPSISRQETRAIGTCCIKHGPCAAMGSVAL